MFCIQEEAVEGSCFSPRRDFWGLSSCKLKAALNLEELPGGAHDEYHVSFWVSAMWEAREVAEGSDHLGLPVLNPKG